MISIPSNGHLDGYWCLIESNNMIMIQVSHDVHVRSCFTMGETSVTGIIDPVCDWALDTRSKYNRVDAGVRLEALWSVVYRNLTIFHASHM